MLSEADAQAFARCMATGGIAAFPADTVYGLACDPHAEQAVKRMALLKRRPLTQPSAVLFFDIEFVHTALPELAAPTLEALNCLLPGAVTVLVPNPRARFPLACGTTPASLGLRVPALNAATAALRGVRSPIQQTSANLHGEPDPRTVAEVPVALLEAADLVLDGGPLPGTPSTVVDLRDFEDHRTFAVLREGAVPAAAIAGRLPR